MILETLLSILSILSISAVGPASAVTPELKCPPTHAMPGAPENSVVVLIDGEIADVAAMGESSSPVEDLLEPESVYRVEIKCWNPDTDELPARRGMPLILITSKAYAGAQRGAVEEAVAAVLAFEEEHGRVPTGLEEIGLPDRPSEATAGPSAASAAERGPVEYGFTKNGWWIANGGGPLAYRCRAEKSDTTEPTAECVPSYGLAKISLRERYERGESGGER